MIVEREGVSHLAKSFCGKLLLYQVVLLVSLIFFTFRISSFPGDTISGKYFINVFQMYFGLCYLGFRSFQGVIIFSDLRDR